MGSEIIHYLQKKNSLQISETNRKSADHAAKITHRNQLVELGIIPSIFLDFDVDTNIV